ncbi:MAG: glycosyltransferase family 2 protein, partial [Selenomonadaceae bacterium]|nr:glycosyltransferase family 2 protein [Selenomonadaceae bacterium]
MKNPAVTVIVAMFNAQDFIADCLTSLLNQTFQDFEIIVADDCSTDSSLAVVQNFLPEFGDRLRILTLS